MAEVRLEGITKRFGENEILNDIDLTVRDGEFFTLVGPSGCGKSTLLHLMAGLETLTDGEIYFDGHPISHLAPKDRDVALVFQSYALYPHMTVYENLAFPLRMKKQPSAEIDRQVRKVAELLGLTSVLSHRPQALSGGQRQRVALGRAIVRQPRVFLLDEPLSNLDAQLRVEMRSELKKLHGTLGATMIYVTHDQVEALVLSDRMAVLQGGIIQQCGTPREVYEQPANLFIASFIGNPPMNLLNGTLSPDRPGILHLGKDNHYDLSLEKGERIQAMTSTRQIVLGIRPEHLQLSRVKDSKAIAIQISLVESVGSELWVEVAVGDQKLKVKTLADFEPKKGEGAYLKLNEAKVRFFDPSTGHRIS